MTEPTYVPKDLCDERSKRIEEGIKSVQDGQGQVKEAIDKLVEAHDTRIAQNDTRIRQNEVAIVELKQREKNGDYFHNKGQKSVAMWVSVIMCTIAVLAVFIPKIITALK